MKEKKKKDFLSLYIGLPKLFIFVVVLQHKKTNIWIAQILTVTMQMFIKGEVKGELKIAKLARFCDWNDWWWGQLFGVKSVLKRPGWLTDIIAEKPRFGDWNECWGGQVWWLRCVLRRRAECSAVYRLLAGLEACGTWPQPTGPFVVSSCHRPRGLARPGQKPDNWLRSHVS